MFADRRDAGRQLASRLGDLSGSAGLAVLGLPRGGVAVAAVVASSLGAPLDVLVARKLRTPGHPELAMGAVAVWGPHEATVTNDAVARHVSSADLARARDAELAAARERAARWSRLSPSSVRTVVLVDDGLATGATMEAAVAVATSAGVSVIVAVPVAAPAPLARVRSSVARVECLLVPEGFGAVGAYYRDFSAVSDSTVGSLLSSAGRVPKGSDEE